MLICGGDRSHDGSDDCGAGGGFGDGGGGGGEGVVVEVVVKSDAT